MCIGYTKYVASISNHVKMGSVTCLFWLPYSKIGVVGTVQNSHVTLFCSMPLVFLKYGVLRTVNGAACYHKISNTEIYTVHDPCFSIFVQRCYRVMNIDDVYSIQESGLEITFPKFPISSS